MTDPRLTAAPTPAAQRLLDRRERQGVRMLVLIRLAFIVVLAIGDVAALTLAPQRLASLALGLVYGGANLALVVALARGAATGRVATIGAALDALAMVVVPIYLAVVVDLAGGGPAALLDAGFVGFALVLVALNALTFRPAAVVVVGGGALAVHLVLIGLALADPSVPVVGVEGHFTGLGVSPELRLTEAGFLAVATATLALVTARARRLLHDGVAAELSVARMGRYFSPAVVAEMAEEPEKFERPGGRVQEVAVMFCDIRDFTAMSEGLAPDAVVAFLSDYQAAMVTAVFAHGGTVDKYVGDAVMATFGTPDTAPDDCARAVACGRAMGRALAELNARRAQGGQPPIRHGIGLHVGPVVAGNVGSPERLEFTVIGDAVNTAARIAEACKTVDRSFLVSDAVLARLDAPPPTTALPPLTVAGKARPLALHAVDDG
jgi:adenylate cyclase